MAQLMELFKQVGSVLVTAEAVVVIVSAILGALAMFFLISYLLEVAACWRIFEKAGQRGWKSLIPVYSSYIRYRLAWRPLWFWISGALLVGAFVLDAVPAEESVKSTLSFVIGAVGTLIYLTSNFRLGRAFGRGILFSLALALFPPLFTLILGFGGSQYQGGVHPTAQAAASDGGTAQ